MVKIVAVFCFFIGILFPAYALSPICFRVDTENEILIRMINLQGHLPREEEYLSVAQGISIPLSHGIYFDFEWIDLTGVEPPSLRFSDTKIRLAITEAYLNRTLQPYLALGIGYAENRETYGNLLLGHPILYPVIDIGFNYWLWNKVSFRFDSDILFNRPSWMIGIKDPLNIPFIPFFADNNSDGWRKSEIIFGSTLYKNINYTFDIGVVFHWL
jgi:hypothetical protein